jgi:hypothetical protein
LKASLPVRTWIASALVASSLMAALALAVPASAANPLTLKCTTSSGEPAADLKVDIANHRMSWDALNYKITHVTDRYITAIDTKLLNTNVGGEVWVLDRVNGKYKRALVVMGCPDPTCPNGPRLAALTYVGRCSQRKT